MPQDISILYQNDQAIAFYWKRGLAKDYKKIQLVFRDTGLLLSKEELVQFAKKIEQSINGSSLCSDCTNNDNCRALLLETPAPQISFAVSHKELMAIKDLVDGTLFQLNLDNLLDGLGS